LVRKQTLWQPCPSVFFTFGKEKQVLSVPKCTSDDEKKTLSENFYGIVDQKDLWAGKAATKRRFLPKQDFFAETIFMCGTKCNNCHAFNH
jgi:hypothetical protein